MKILFCINNDGGDAAEMNKNYCESEKWKCFQEQYTKLSRIWNGGREFSL